MRRTLMGSILGAVGALEGLAAMARFEDRKRLYAAAEKRATALGRPLVVVGDPDAGMHTRILRAYQCGDICVDLNGCPACPVQYVVDLTKQKVPNLADDSAVVFVSCVLEYVADPEPVLKELLRIAGGPDNLYIVTVQPWTMTATLYPGARQRGEACGGRVTLEPVSSTRKLAYATALAALALGAIVPEK